jgi:hypothetical protein
VVVLVPRICAAAGEPPATTRTAARARARTGGSLPAATTVVGCTSYASPCAR